MSALCARCGYVWRGGYADQAQTHVSAMRQVGFGGGGGAVHIISGPDQAQTHVVVSREDLHSYGYVQQRYHERDQARGSFTHTLLHTHSLQGTQTHMAPETLLRSQQGKASDV